MLSRISKGLEENRLETVNKGRRHLGGIQPLAASQYLSHVLFSSTGICLLIVTSPALDLIIVTQVIPNTVGMPQTSVTVLRGDAERVSEDEELSG